MSANLAAAIVAQAEARPDLRLGTVKDQLTLPDALALAAARARELLASGLEPGQRVALVAPTSTDYLVTWLACVLAGLGVTSLSCAASAIPRVGARLGTVELVDCRRAAEAALAADDAPTAREAARAVLAGS